MKVCYLDFDGTINNFHTHSNSTGTDFSATACTNLNKLLNSVPDLKIVVSSSWRMWGLTKMKEILAKNGIDPDKVIDITGDEPGERGDQIQAWLDRNSNVDGFVILDDEQDMGHLIDHLVHTNAYVGLTEENVKEAIKILNK
jgi:hypothetical protein